MLDSLKSGAYNDMTNNELYDLVLEKRYNVLFPNCLLLLVKIINFDDHGGYRLQDKGFTQLRQREERDVRELRRNVEKKCKEFLRCLRISGEPFQVKRGGKGLFTSAGLNRILLPLESFAHQSGFHYNLRLSFLKLVRILNSAYTYKGTDIYDVDRNDLAQAFRLAASHLEWALAQHAASIWRQVPEEDLAISSLFNQLTINSSSQQTKYIPRPGVSQTRTAPAPSSSRYRSAPTCTKCKQIGHSSPSCPKTRCYRCKYSLMLLFCYTTTTLQDKES